MRLYLVPGSLPATHTHTVADGSAAPLPHIPGLPLPHRCRFGSYPVAGVPPGLILTTFPNPTRLRLHYIPGPALVYGFAFVLTLCRLHIWFFYLYRPTVVTRLFANTRHVTGLRTPWTFSTRLVPLPGPS